MKYYLSEGHLGFIVQTLLNLLIFIKMILEHALLPSSNRLLTEGMDLHIINNLLTIQCFYFLEEEEDFPDPVPCHRP